MDPGRNRTDRYVVVIHDCSDSSAIEIAPSKEYPQAGFATFWEAKEAEGTFIVGEFATSVAAEVFVSGLGDNPTVELYARWAEYQEQ
jgi:hypothetical protein